MTEDLAGLQFEIECGMKRWMGLNEITQHRLESDRGFVTYSYELTPPSDDLAEMLQMSRWFRKMSNRCRVPGARGSSGAPRIRESPGTADPQAE